MLAQDRDGILEEEKGYFIWKEIAQQTNEREEFESWFSFWIKMGNTNRMVKEAAESLWLNWSVGFLFFLHPSIIY